MGGRRGAPGVTVVAVLAFGVFGVHTLFTDETVDEARPTFRSGAAPTTSPDSGTPDSGHTRLGHVRLGHLDPRPTGGRLTGGGDRRPARSTAPAIIPVVAPHRC